MQEWLWASAADLGRGIEAGEIDPVALTDTYLAAIDAHPMRDRIYARVTADRARSEARAAAARAREGQRLSPLDGVPISWKDLFDTAGTATEAGTKMLAGRVPTEDAQVLKHAAQAGLVCLGKTHLTEIAFSGLGLNPMTATPPCKNYPESVPGGSSSGAAASLAFGLAAAAIGSDTGGSVRVPSAWNDLVGLKTTHGRLSTVGVVPLCKTFDTVGPLCRTVEDAALVLAALEPSKAVDLRGASLKGARFAILDTVAMEGLRDAPRAAFQSAAERLNAAGAEITHIAFEPLRRAFELAGILFTVDAYSNWRDIIEADPSKMYPQTLNRIRPGGSFAAVDYFAAWAELEDIRAGYSQLTAGFDAILTPTVPSLPPNIERLETDSDFFVEENLLALRNTRVGNLLGLCGLTLPTGVPSTGILLNGPAGGEEKLLRLGAAAQAALS